MPQEFIDALLWGLPGVALFAIGQVMVVRSQVAGRQSHSGPLMVRIGFTLAALGILLAATLPLVVRGQTPIGLLVAAAGVALIWYPLVRVRQRTS